MNIGELAPWAVTALALVYSFAESVLKRYRAKTDALLERFNAVAEMDEIELERDRGELRTREVVDNLLTLYIKRHDELIERLENERQEAALRNAEHIRQIDELTNTFNVALLRAKSQFETRIKALERALEEKDRRIADLKKRLGTNTDE